MTRYSYNVIVDKDDRDVFIRVDLRWTRLNNVILKAEVTIRGKYHGEFEVRTTGHGYNKVDYAFNKALQLFKNSEEILKSSIKKIIDTSDSEFGEHSLEYLAKKSNFEVF